MTTLHPWLSTPEAYAAASKAVAIPMTLMAGRAQIVGADELLSEALTILTECALPRRELGPSLCAQCNSSLDGVRMGAKFCSRQCKNIYSKDVYRRKSEPIPARSGAHIGSMWTWPEAERPKYAIRQVGYCLNNYCRTIGYASEIPADVYNMDYNNWFASIAETEPDARETVEEYLESKGIRTDGTEALEELAEAALFARKAG